jgi:predicted unusual protein kinase regulating ubiquinone biosynthesis (AarF/ABC1/UbiB family)
MWFMSQHDRPTKLSVAWNAGRLAGRRLLRRQVGERDLALGDALTGQLDQMKGLAMKLGQIVSYLDVPLPDAVQDQLARLQTGTLGMGEGEARAVIEGALGAPVEALFDEVDWHPIAAASIGQVHRARVGGRAVAVKVQYPSVAASFSEDLRAVGRLASLASLATAVDGRALVAELRERLTEECDYEREARAQQAFARAFRGDPDVRIPGVLAERSTGAVLTTEWAEGRGFSWLLGSTLRDAAARTLVRFSYRSLLQLGAIQADPHPGNFLFGEAPGRVVCLDFGCVRRLDEAMVEALREIALSLRAGDRSRFREAAQALGVVGNPRRFDFDHFHRTMEHLHRPLLVPRFTFDLEYAREGYELNGPKNPNARHMSMPPAYIWVARLQWGLWSVLGRLGASGGFAEVLDELLAAPPAPLEVEAPVERRPQRTQTAHSAAAAGESAAL